jgi:RNA polymerase sigma-70 factor, ECF subfamily
MVDSRALPGNIARVVGKAGGPVCHIAVPWHRFLADGSQDAEHRKSDHHGLWHPIRASSIIPSILWQSFLVWSPGPHDKTDAIMQFLYEMTAAAILPQDLRAIYEAEVNNVAHSLRRLGAPSADVEDLTQEVFVRAFQHLERFDPSRPIRPWLFGIAFRVMSEARRGAPKLLATDGDDVDEIVDPNVPPDRALELSQDRALVLRALDELTPERRVVFVMYELGGYSMPEIAETLAVRLFTAYSRLRVARAQFAVSARRLRRELSRTRAP